MESLQAGGFTLQREALEPFGEQWSPDRPLDLQQYVADNPEFIAEHARRALLLVIRDTEIADGQLWRSIAPSTPDRSTQLMHAEYLGDVDMLLWKLDGQRRAPTSFVPSESVRAAMVQHRDMIALSETDVPKGVGAYEEHLRNIYANLEQEDVSNADLNMPHTLLWYVDRDMRLDGLTSHRRYHRFLIEDWWEATLGRATVKRREAEEQMRRSVRALVREKLLHFHTMLTQTLAADTYAVDWNTMPDAGVVAWNRLRDEADHPMQAAMHFAKPSVDVADQDRLLRAEVDAGKVYLVEKKGSS